MIYFILFLIAPFSLMASSGLFWTPCTTDVMEVGMGNIEVDNYFSVFNRNDHGSFFNPNVGFNLGLFSWNELNAEVGVDYYGGANDPIYATAKVGVSENVLFPYAPSFSFGVCEFNTRRHINGQIIYDWVIGKVLPESIGGRFFVGGYAGNRLLGRVREGLMVGFDYSFCPAIYCDGREYDRWNLAADYATGKNAVGGGGFGLTYYFTPDICLQTGPVWFNSVRINGPWTWSVCIDILIPIFTPPSYCSSQ